MQNKLTDELAVCGFNAVKAAAEYHGETINRLFLRKDRLKSFTKICKSLAEQKRPYKICEDGELERLCKTTHHQGVVAMIEAPVMLPLSREDLEAWAAGGKTGLVLHSVGNDHNLGAIVRSAAFFDAAFVVISKGDSGARLSTSAYRVAEGGMEHVTLRSIHNTSAFLKDASRALVTIGAEGRSRQRLCDIAKLVEEKAALLKTPTKGRPGIAVVLGNEEAGLPKEVKEKCAALMRIPGTGLMESLNVAQAATLFLYAIFEM